MKSQNEHLAEKLESCYLRFHSVISDPGSDAEAVEKALAEMETVFLEFKETFEQATPDGEQDLAGLSRQSGELIQSLKIEMNRITAELASLKQGKRMHNAYHSHPEIGLGFSEGKFFDLKK